MKQRPSTPGTILFYDLQDDLQDYSVEEAGQLLWAMLNYGTTGETPEFSDRSMRTLWRKVQASMDRCRENYAANTRQRQYARYCRTVKEHCEVPLSFDEWLDMTDEDVRP